MSELKAREGRDEADVVFGKAVKALRQERGMSQEQLVAQLIRHGLSDATPLIVSRIESGKRNVRLAEALAFSYVFGVPIPGMVKQDDSYRNIAMFEATKAKIRDVDNSLFGEIEEVSKAVGAAATELLRSALWLRQIGLDHDAEYLASIEDGEAMALQLLSQLPGIAERTVLQNVQVPRHLLEVREWDTPRSARNKRAILERQERNRPDSSSGMPYDSAQAARNRERRAKARADAE